MPTDRELREARQRAIRALLARSPVAHQAELVAELRRRGTAATRVAGGAGLRRWGRPAGPYLTVVQTAVGAAQGVARALDAAGWPEVVGSLAGDDTVFLATATEQDQ